MRAYQHALFFCEVYTYMVYEGKTLFTYTSNEGELEHTFS